MDLEEVTSGHIPDQKILPHEKIVLELIKDWQAGKDYFVFNTSGSTGKPKSIKIHRSMIEYSCQVTFDKINPDHTFNSALLCIQPNMIGGAMVVFRALIFDLDLTVVRPCSNPIEDIQPDEKFDLTSLVPFQLYNLPNKHLNKFHTILVGGAELTLFHHQSKAKIYACYGMTETVSHIALRELSQEFFECVGDARVSVNSDSELLVNGTITNNQPLQTYDVVRLRSDRCFRWIGRSDFVINTGGVKVHPEYVEQRLNLPSNRRFIISSLPDRTLGNKIVLIIEGQPTNQPVDFNGLSTYEKPKNTYFLDRFVLTDSGKINRLKTQKFLIKKLSSTE